MNTITYTVRNNYGNTAYYPHNDIAKQFVKNMGQKTLTLNDIGTLRDLGLKVEEAQREG